MVVHHWSDDGMVMYHRRSLTDVKNSQKLLWVGELFAPVPGAVFAFFGLKAYSSKRNNAFRWLHTVKRFEQPLQNVDCGASSS